MRDPNPSRNESVFDLIARRGSIDPSFVTGGGITASLLSQLVTAGAMDRVAARAISLVRDGRLDERDLRQLLGTSADRPTLPAPEFTRHDSPLVIGSVFGRHPIRSRLGGGRSGTVYVSMHPALGVPVAMKVSPATDPEAAEHVAAEACTLVRIRHRNVIGVFDTDRIDGRTVMVSEFADGESLDRAVERGPVPLKVAFRAVRQRANTAVRILQTCPAPLVSTDDRGTVRYMKPAAEQAFGKPLAQAMRGPLGNLVGPPAGDPDPLDRPGLPADGAAGWLGHGAAPDVADSTAGSRRFHLTASRSVVQTDGMWCVVAQDTVDEYARFAADRARVRADTLTAAWAAADAAAGESAEVILAQTRMLTGEAKQSAHREIFLPRLTAVRDYASDLDIQFQLTRWLTASFGGELPASRPVEFLAGEVIRGAVGQLALRMKARNNTFSVVDQGGWVCCDEDRLRTAVLGVLAHACAANRDTVIGVRLRKLAGGPAGREGSVAVEVIDAGPRLTSD